MGLLKNNIEYHKDVQLSYLFIFQGRLPVKWTAYEALLYGTYTTQSDV